MGEHTNKRPSGNLLDADEPLTSRIMCFMSSPVVGYLYGVLTQGDFVTGSP